MNTIARALRIITLSIALPSIVSLTPGCASAPEAGEISAQDTNAPEQASLEIDASNNTVERTGIVSFRVQRRNDGSIFVRGSDAEGRLVEELSLLSGGDGMVIRHVAFNVDGSPGAQRSIVMNERGEVVRLDGEQQMDSAGLQGLLTDLAAAQGGQTPLLITKDITIDPDQIITPDSDPSDPPPSTLENNGDGYTTLDCAFALAEAGLASATAIITCAEAPGIPCVIASLAAAKAIKHAADVCGNVQ